MWGISLSTMEDVPNRGGYHDKCGDILTTMGVFSTLGDIMSTVEVVLSTVEDTQYRGVS